MIALLQVIGGAIGAGVLIIEIRRALQPGSAVRQLLGIEESE